MFFAGRLKRPPFETKNRVHALVKKHDNSFIRNTADKFRFEMLQTRFFKFMELTEKQMLARELGRPSIGRPAAPPPPPPPPPETAPAEKSAAPPDARHSAQAGARATAEKAREAAAEHVIKFGKQDDGAARVKELYEQLAAAKKQVGEAPVSFDRVQALVKAQVQKLGSEGNVAFKIGMKDGKVSLTVKSEKEKE